MKRIETILKKIIVVQLVFLFCTQIFLHHFHFFPELNDLVLYEGVNGNNYEKIVQTLNQP